MIEIAPDAVHRCGSLRLADLPGPPQDDDEAADRAAELADRGDHATLCERMALPSKSTRGRPLCTEVLPHVVACGGYNGVGNLVGPVAARAAVALALDATAPPEYFAS